MRAVVDSNVLLGARLERDQWHEQGRAIISAIDGGDLPRSRLLDFCLPEVLTPLERHHGGEPAKATLEFLETSRGFDIEPTTRDDFVRGVALYRAQADIEIVDCIVVSHMRRAGIEYVYSFDDDFDRFVDITRLQTADSPAADE